MKSNVKCSSCNSLNSEFRKSSVWLRKWFTSCKFIHEWNFVRGIYFYKCDFKRKEGMVNHDFQASFTRDVLSLLSFLMTSVRGSGKTSG